MCTWQVTRSTQRGRRVAAILQSPDNTNPVDSSSSAVFARRHRSKLRSCCWLACLGSGLLFWIGSDRVPADPTSVLRLQGVLSTDSPTSDRLRLATFNIHGGRGRQASVDLDRTAACLRDLDFIGLYEVHGGIRGNQVEQLGTRLGMGICFVPTERRWWHDHFGNGILSRVHLSGLYRLPLECTQGKKYRNAVLSVVELRSGSVRILSVHLDRLRDRARQLASVTQLFLSLESPAVLMGDLNTTRSDPQLRQVLKQADVIDVLADTKHAHTPRRIDWMLIRGLHCRQADLVDNHSSDHPVIRAVLEWDSPEQSKQVGNPRHGRALLLQPLVTETHGVDNDRYADRHAVDSEAVQLPAN